MRIPILLTLLASLVLASCGWRDSRVNPRNWFGNSRDVPVETVAEEEVNPLIPTRRSILERNTGPDASVPIGTITELRIEPTPSGAIVYASGIADRQGAFRARLVPDTDDLSAVDGVLGFTLRVEYPRDATPVGSEFSRTVHEAYTLSSQTLAQVRTIRVSGERNAKESRRR
jgi:hypothetical protein